MPRCLDCGFCGFYIDLLRGLKWEEMSSELRSAYEQGIRKNPHGQEVGTGHWNYVKCLKGLNVDWHDSVVSPEQLKETLAKERQCKGYFKYYAGSSPPQHHDIQRQQTGLHLKQWNTRIALLALIASVISLILTFTRW